jgi:anhydro-N-acetylmuramic acid kinase
LRVLKSFSPIKQDILEYGHEYFHLYVAFPPRPEAQHGPFCGTTLARGIAFAYATFMKSTYVALGLMSGTSLDGVDICRIETDGENRVTYRSHFYKAYPQELKDRLTTISRGDIPLADVLRLEHDVTLQYAEAILSSGLLEGVDVIGCHGQTVRHLPQEGLTWQLGDASLLAQRVAEGAGRAIPTVMDFRRRDLAAGGEGAPLVPLFHKVMLAGRGLPAAVLNIGGVANASFVDENGHVSASDCGPGMGLLDSLMRERTGQDYDKDGALSQQGTVQEFLLNSTLAQTPFWQRPVPRSADRYEFYGIMEALKSIPVEDAAATLAAFTVAGVDTTLKELGAAPETLQALFLVGGGTFNRAVVKGLQAAGWKVFKGDDLGWEPLTVEASCFAWLAVRRLKGLVTSLPSTTHAKVPTVGGVVAYGEGTHV